MDKMTILFIVFLFPLIDGLVRPNVIIMIMDDMGFGDLGINGDPARETPNLDKMANEGVLLTDLYSPSPLCSPSRAALLTGRLPVRNGFYTNNKDGRNSYTPQEIVQGIQDSEILLPELLAKLNYTNKIIGKWHLGHRKPYLPLKHGFHHFYGSTNCHFGPYDNIERPNIAFFEDDHMIGRYYEEIEIDPYNHISNLTQIYTTKAIDFIKSAIRPFFLYWSPDATHAPTYRSPQFVGTSKKLNSYGDAIIELDHSIGRILNTIRSDKSLQNNTLVFFTSDNGAALVSKTDAGSNYPFVCGKQTTFEGGIRMPGIVWWPNVIKPGISSQISSLMDFFPTIINAAKGEMPRDRIYDGLDIMNSLINKKIKERSIFHYRGNRLMAIRKGEYKAHFWTWVNSWEEFKSGIDFCPGINIPLVTTHQVMNYSDKPIIFQIIRDPGEHYKISSGREYEEIMPKMIQEYRNHIDSIVFAKPLLNLCDQSVMHWSPPGCEKLKKCLPIPPSNLYKCDWPH